MPMDMTKLTMMGHSFGGMTSLEVARKYPEDVKYCVSLDPYFMHRQEELLVNNYGTFFINQPLAIISTSRYHFRKTGFVRYDSFACLKAFWTNC